MTATPIEMLNGSPEMLKSCDETAWFGLVRYLLDQLADWLGNDMNTEPLENACAGEGFCIDILHSTSPVNPFVHWKGILGASIVDSSLRVSLLVFLYSGSERLVTKSGHEFAEYIYEAGSADDGRWVLNGWFNDEFGEYNQF